MRAERRKGQAFKNIFKRVVKSTLKKMNKLCNSSFLKFKNDSNLCKTCKAGFQFWLTQTPLDSFTLKLLHILLLSGKKFFFLSVQLHPFSCPIFPYPSNCSHPYKAASLKFSLEFYSRKKLKKHLFPLKKKTACWTTLLASWDPGPQWAQHVMKQLLHQNEYNGSGTGVS